MNQTELTVIIPHYQSADTLEKCLLSIPVREEIQILIVDDKSPDIEQWKSLKCKFPLFTFIRLEKNGGAGSARNAGLRLAQGKWLVFADADDYFLPDAFDCFKDYYNSKADIVFFKSQSWDVVQNMATNRHLKRSGFVVRYINGEKGAEDHLRYRWHCPWGKMIRKSMVDEHHLVFDETMYSNDAMFSIKAGYYARLIEADRREVYCVTVSPNSLTKKVNYESIMCRYRVLGNCNNFLKSIGEAKNQMVALRYFIIAFKYERKCIVPMIKYSLKNHISIFAGLNKWFEFFQFNTKFSHF